MKRVQISLGEVSFFINLDTYKDLEKELKNKYNLLTNQYYITSRTRLIGIDWNFNKHNEIYYKHFINNYIQYYDIVSLLANNKIAKFGGMEKYLRDYEYENILCFQNFIIFYEHNKDIVEPIYRNIQLAKSDKDKWMNGWEPVFKIDNGLIEYKKYLNGTP